MDFSTRCYIAGTGHSVPSRVFRNADFCQSLGTSDEWIRTRTGICERRYASQSENTTTLAERAARQALENAKVQPSDLRFILVATVTPNQMAPSTACQLQALLQTEAIPAFDINAACSGFLYGLGIGTAMLEAQCSPGKDSYGLIVGSEVLSRALNPKDRTTCVIFGDGAGAAVIGLSDPQGNHRSGAIHRLELHANGSQGHLIEMPSRVTSNPELTAIRMQGRVVFKFAVQTMKEAIEKAEIYSAKLGLSIRLVVPHQVNLRIIERVREDLGWSCERFFLNLARYGNTSAASIPIALDEARRTNQVKTGDTVLLIAFGGGLTWASAIITL